MTAPILNVRLVAWCPSAVLVGLNRLLVDGCWEEFVKLLFSTYRDHSTVKHVSYLDNDSRYLMRYVYICTGNTARDLRGAISYSRIVVIP